MKPQGKWARDPLDWYVEPSWTSARLFECERFEGNIIDPACGRGTILESARAARLHAYGYDVVGRGAGAVLADFMRPTWSSNWDCHNIVCNPPFGLCDERKVGGFLRTFWHLALLRAERKVALLLPSTWHLADKRSRWLETTPLRRIWNLTPRPSMPPGVYLEAGNKAGNGTQDFAWYVWLKGYDGPVETRWLRRDP